MINGRKGSALLLVGLMIMSGLVAFSAPVIADEQATLNSVTWTAAYDDANMIDHPGVDAADETLVINEAGNGAGDNLLYLGDRDVTLQLNITPEIANAGPNHTFTISFSPAASNTLISVDSSNNDEDLDFWPMPIGNATSGYIVDFQIDIGNMGIVETAYEMICTIRNDNSSATTSFTFWIYVSSAFHDDSTDDTGEEAHEFTRASGEYVVEEGANATIDPEFEAGDMFKEAELILMNNADFTMRNPQANLSAPTDDKNGIVGADIELVKPNCRIEDDIAAGTAVQDSDGNNLLWRVNVEERTPPGVTQGEVIMTYERQINGVYTLIRENVRPIDFAVDFTFADQDVTESDGQYSPFACYATSVAIVDDGTVTRQVDYAAPYAVPSLEQSTYTNKKIRVNVSIVNNGNIDMVNVVFAVFPDDWDTAGGYFQNPSFFYHETGVIDTDGLTLTVASLIFGG